MTFDQGTNPTSDDPFDSFDPLIADRFEVLNSVRVPGQGERLQPLHPGAPPATGYRPFVGLAAAAALFVVVGVSFLAMRPNTDQDVTASNGQNAVAGGGTLDEDQNGDGDVQELTVSLPASSTTQPPADASGDSTPPASNQEGDEEEGSPKEAPGSTGAGQTEATDPSAPDTTAKEQGTTSTQAPTTKPTTPTTNSTPKESMPPISAPVPVPTTQFPDLEEQVIILRGIIEEVFTDCESVLILDENGNVAQGGPVTCDGGSYVVIDGRRVQTSAGYVPADQYYDRHNSRIRPGQSVVVLAVPSSWSEDILTLKCGQCGITLGG